MNATDFASLLFFTRAAVLRDPALANARLAGELADWGVLRVNGDRSLKGEDDPPLTLGGLLRVWDEADVAHDCPNCRAPALFLHGSGCGMLHWHFRAAWHCPFCGRTDEIRFDGLSRGRELLGPVSRAIRAIRRDVAFDPPGLPFAEAVSRLRVLRDADLLDPAHPLEAESLAPVAAVRPFLRVDPFSFRAAAVRDARIRAELLTPERLAAAQAVLDDVRSRQRLARAAAEAELDSLRARPGDPGPKARLSRGEITREEYRAIRARKRTLADSIRSERLASEREDALAVFLAEDLGRALSADERRVLVESLDDDAAGGSVADSPSSGS